MLSLPLRFKTELPLYSSNSENRPASDWADNQSNGFTVDTPLLYANTESIIFSFTSTKHLCQKAAVCVPCETKSVLTYFKLWSRGSSLITTQTGLQGRFPYTYCGCKTKERNIENKVHSEQEMRRAVCSTDIYLPAILILRRAFFFLWTQQSVFHLKFLK